jgi:hypothetical protein
VWQPEEGSFMKSPRNKDKQHFSPTDAAVEGSNTGTTRNAMKEKVAADKPTRDIVRANQAPREARTFEHITHIVIPQWPATRAAELPNSP